MNLLHVAVCCALLSGCAVAGVPAAVQWTTVGAGLGFGTAALTFDTEALKVWDAHHPAQPPAKAP